MFKAPESPSNLKAEVAKHDQDHILKMCQQCDTFAEDDLIEVKRLGPKDKDKTRPISVTLKDTHTKARLMKNVRKLKNAPKPYNDMRVAHDLTPTEQRREKELRLEAKQKNEKAKADGENFIYIVKGLPGERRVTWWEREANLTAVEEGGAAGGWGHPPHKCNN